MAKTATKKETKPKAKKVADKFVVVHYLNDKLVSYCHASEVFETEEVQIISDHDNENAAKSAQMAYAKKHKLNHQYI